MDSFSQFYKKIIWLYQCFGVAPSRLALNQTKKSSFICWLPPVLLVIVYWAALIYALATRTDKSDLMSTVSNYIQILCNAFALSVILIGTPVKSEAFKGILHEFDQIDHQLQEFDHPINVDRQNKIFKFGLSIFCFLSTGVNVYDIVVTKVSVLYWTVHAIPPVIYGICLQQASFLIYCTVIRCRMINDLLVQKKFTKKAFSFAPLMPGQVVVTPPRHVRGKDESIKTVYIKTVYQLTTGIHNLCEKINSFFGLPFLVSLMAIFAVTSIQGFYCYKLASNIDESRNRTYWTMLASLNVLLLNIVLVTVLTFVSDMVSNEASNINSGVRNLDDDQVIQYSSWLHPVLINIKISAFGFFNLNCTMLCGFLSALITYLLILVQCNEIAGNSASNHISYNAGYNAVSNG